MNKTRYIGYSFAALIFMGVISCSSTKKITSGTFAPDSTLYSGGVVQIYSARTLGAKQAFSVHTWISVKPSGEKYYTSYEIIGWKLKRGNTALSVRKGIPDRDWWGHQPTLLLDYRKEDVDVVINKVVSAIERYPYKNEYQAYPGPNSNTFTASIAREVPELGLDLPSTAIGKDYKSISSIFGMSPSGTGVQASFWGLLGMTVGVEEGIELNILGLNFELDVFDLAVELPGVGRLGAEPAVHMTDTQLDALKSKTQEQKMVVDKAN